MRTPRPRRAISVRGAASALSLLVALVVAVLLVLLLRGRNEPSVSRAAYSHALSGTLGRLGTDFRQAGVGGDPAATSAGLRRTKSAIDRAAARISALRAPHDAAAAQRALVSELHDYADEIDVVRASVDFGDPATILVHLHEVNAPAAINRTLDSLAARGYDVPARVARIRQ